MSHFGMKRHVRDRERDTLGYWTALPFPEVSDDCVVRWRAVTSRPCVCTLAFGGLRIRQTSPGEPLTIGIGEGGQGGEGVVQSPLSSEVPSKKRKKTQRKKGGSQFSFFCSSSFVSARYIYLHYFLRRCLETYSFHETLQGYQTRITPNGADILPGLSFFLPQGICEAHGSEGESFFKGGGVNLFTFFLVLYRQVRIFFLPFYCSLFLSSAGFLLPCWLYFGALRCVELRGKKSGSMFFTGMGWDMITSCLLVSRST